MNREITDYDQVTTPALTDKFLCQQSGITKNETAAQILSNIANLSAAGTLTGTETTVIRQNGVTVKVDLDTLGDLLLESLI